jgi:hypothetical protein
VTSFAYDPANATAFFTNNHFDFRDLMAVDLRTGEVRRLLREARIGEIAFNPADRSLIGVRHEDGHATLVRIPYPYEAWTKLHEFPWEHVPTDLDVSPEGRLLSASVNDDRGEQYLRVWELDRVIAGDLRPLREFHFGQSVPENFAFSKDGRYLYGASYYTGVSNIFRCEIATGRIDAVTNAETGFFRPVPLADGRLVAAAYTADGFVPVAIEPRVLEDVSAIRFLGAELAQKHPVVREWQVPDPATIDDAKLVGPPSPYVPLERVRAVNAYPVLQGYRESVGFGVRVNAEDPLLFASLSVTASWTPDPDLPGNERGHLNVEGRYRGWRAGLFWNRTDFYDIVGPVERSRKGFAATLGRNWTLASDDPRKLELVADAGFYDRIDTLPWAQNIPTDFNRMFTLAAGLRFQELRKSLGAIEDEKGATASLIAHAHHANGETTPQVTAHFDWGVALPQPHASLWLRTAAGAGDASGEPSLARFYFGSFRNNWLDHGAPKRYRDVEAFPGFGIEEIAALRYLRGMAEWNLSPILIENGGTPGFHASALRPSLFAAGLLTHPGGGASHRRYASVGGQLDLALGVLHKYEMTLSAGYAVGFAGARRAGDEWMLSLKIM